MPETAARLVPALAALAIVGFTWWLGAALVSSEVGFAAALLLTVNPALVALARYAILDTVLTMFLFGGLALLTVAMLRDRPRLQWTGYALVGLATFTKGPIALALCATAVVLLVLRGDRALLDFVIQARSLRVSGRACIVPAVRPRVARPAAWEPRRNCRRPVGRAADRDRVDRCGTVLSFLMVERLDLPVAALAVPLALLACGVADAAGRFWERRPSETPWIAVTAMTAVYIGALVWVVPAFEEQKVVKDLAQWVGEAADSQDQIAAYRLNRWSATFRF